MNAGARAAKGDLYLFLHADTVVPVGFDETLRGAFHDPKVLMTCFQFGVNRELLRGRPPVGLSLMERVTNYRTRKLHLPYGDQVNLSLGHAAGVPPPSPVHGRDRLRLSSVQATVEMAVDMRPYMDPHHLQVHVIIPDRTLHTRQAFCFSAHKFKAMGGFPNFVMMEVGAHLLHFVLYFGQALCSVHCHSCRCRWLLMLMPSVAWRASLKKRPLLSWQQA